MGGATRWVLGGVVAAFACVGVVASPPAAGAGPALPAWLAPGARASWYQGSATIPSVGTLLEQDDQGNWVDKNGKKYREVDNPSTAGAGYRQMTVLAAGEAAVAVEFRSFLLMDPQGGRMMSNGTEGLVGTARSLADYWISPTDLAAKQEVREGGLTIRRLKYPLRGRTFDAIVFETRSGSSYQRTTYDLATGLLLVASTSSTGRGGFTPNPNGTSSFSAGSTTITSTVLADLRALKLPWGADPTPATVTRGLRLDFRGTFSIVVPGAPVIPQALATALVFGAPEATWAPFRFHSALTPIAGGRPQENTVNRVAGAATTMPAWIGPATFAKLRPGTVVDDDPVTKFRTTFAGVQGGIATVVEEGPYDRYQGHYDVATGLLVGATSAQQNGVGQTQIQVRRVSR